MTVQPSGSADAVAVTIDGFEITVPKGTLIIRAAEQLGIQIPRFCDHPLLAPVGACRQCLVHVEGQPKPPASCTTTVTDGMVVRTQLTSPVAEKAQRGIMELLLVNHPLDCPMCDKGGECPLQNQAMSTGQGETRFDRHQADVRQADRAVHASAARPRALRPVRPVHPIRRSDRRRPADRAASSAVRKSRLASPTACHSTPTSPATPCRSARSARSPGRPTGSGPGPSTLFPRRACASTARPGCRQRTDHRRGAVTRRLAGNEPAVNEEWNCDKGRWAFSYATEPDRLVSPLVRDADGVLQPASWPEALLAAARGLLAARGRAGVLPGGRLTLEDAYAYAKFARVALASNDIDMRTRPHSAEELQFLAEQVAGRRGLSYAALERAPVVLLAGFEPEEECPIVFLRLRKAARAGTTTVYSLAALASHGLRKMSGVLLPTVPGAEAAALTALADQADDGVAAARGLRQPGAVILVGERLAEVPGALSAAARLAATTGATLAWIPRRAGERGAIEAGALPNLLPGGRRIGEPEVTGEVARAWGVGSLPADPGFSTSEILAAATTGDIEALLIGAVDPDDLPDPAAALAAIEKASFVVSLELRVSAVTDRADVVFPVAAVAEKQGTFVNWEGRPGSFTAALAVPAARTDLDVLAALADEMDVHLGLPDAASARRELTMLSQSPALSPAQSAAHGRMDQERHSQSRPLQHPGVAEALLATWHNLLDAGRMQDGEPNLAGTARAAVARMSAATAAEAGTADGGKVTVATGHGAITVPVEIADMPDRVVWLPANSAGSAVRRALGAGHGTLVSLRSAE